MCTTNPIKTNANTEAKETRYHEWSKPLREESENTYESNEYEKEKEEVEEHKKKRSDETWRRRRTLLVISACCSCISNHGNHNNSNVVHAHTKTVDSSPEPK